MVMGFQAPIGHQMHQLLAQLRGALGTRMLGDGVEHAVADAAQRLRIASLAQGLVQPVGKQ